jgi:hypothetical protein
MILVLITGVPAAGGCRPAVQIPPKLLPAYGLAIQFPAGETEAGSLTIKPGASVVLPVNIRSVSDVPFRIRLTQASNIVTPSFITLAGPARYTELQPGANVTIEVNCTIAADAVPGRYNAAIHGELEKPVANRTTESMGFQVIITDK